LINFPPEGSFVVGVSKASARQNTVNATEPVRLVVSSADVSVVGTENPEKVLQQIWRVLRQAATALKVVV